MGLAAVIVVAIIAVLAAVERSEHLRSKVADVRAETAYRDAKLARELAEVAVNEYAEGTYPRELATAEGEIKQAEDELSGVETPDPISVWAERIRSKGYLLLITASAVEGVRCERATFAIEQAKSRKLVLEWYTKVKTLRESQQSGPRKPEWTNSPRRRVTTE